MNAGGACLNFSKSYTLLISLHVSHIGCPKEMFLFKIIIKKTKEMAIERSFTCY